MKELLQTKLKEFEECTWCHNSPNCNCVLIKRLDRLEELIVKLIQEKK